MSTSAVTQSAWRRMSKRRSLTWSRRTGCARPTRRSRSCRASSGAAATRRTCIDGAAWSRRSPMTRPVTPSHVRPARLAPLACLPVFLSLAGKRVVVAGEGPPVVWKAELMAAAGAQVTVYAPEPEPELEALADAYPDAVALQRRAWKPQDFEGAAVAIGDITEL